MRTFVKRLVRPLPNTWKLKRMVSGGVWVLFKNGEWANCKVYESSEGYFVNPHDWGHFHKTFNAIVSIETYP